MSKKMKSDFAERAPSRRSFVKTTTLVGLAALASAAGTGALFGCKKEAAEEDALSDTPEVPPEEGEVVWAPCTSCGYDQCACTVDFNQPEKRL